MNAQNVWDDADSLAQLLSHALRALDIVAHERMLDEFHRTRFAHDVYYQLSALAQPLIDERGNHNGE